MKTIFLWRAVGFVTAILSGYLIGHVIVLARYFDWLIANGYASMLEDTYAVFRVEGDPVTPYIGSFFIQFLLAIALLITGLRQRKRFGAHKLAMAACAVLALPLTMFVFTVSGFHHVEHHVMAATDLSESTLETWLAMNVPLHVLSAALYVAAAMMIVFTEPPRRNTLHRSH
ncbi:MAG: hypothetical protein AAF311_04315 [Pseudomonadota bacterium]